MHPRIHASVAIKTQHKLQYLQVQMSTKTSLATFLISFFFYCCYRQPTQQPSGFRLVQQWPSAFCYLNPDKCNRTRVLTVINFTIHGLWPYDSKGRSIRPPCGGSNFDGSMVKNITKELDKAWPNFSIRNKKNVDFWRYEWNQHGRCSESLLDGKSYFETALHLKNKFDILETLQDAGIRPNNQSYSAQNVSDAIRNKLKFEPDLSCQKNNATGKLLFMEVYLCVDKSRKEFVNCTFKGNSCFHDPQHSNPVVFIA